jgi:hypothetical protein
MTLNAVFSLQPQPRQLHFAVAAFEPPPSRAF